MHNLAGRRFVVCFQFLPVVYVPQNLDWQGKVRCRVGDSNHDSSKPGGGRHKGQSPEEEASLCQGCWEVSLSMGKKRHCSFRFHIPHLSCSVLRSPLLLSAREVISCVYVALPIKGSSLAGTAGCEARLW
ncbi:hypothetical protein CH063_12767, partial [Colletotrichum higginsianum]